MMELDELKEQWAQQNEKLEQNIRLNRRLLTWSYLEGARSRLHRLRAFTAVHAALWVLCVEAPGIYYLYEHRNIPRFALAAVALEVYSIGVLISLIRQLALVAGIDYSQPVANIQRQIEAVKVARIQMTKWAVLAGVVAWIPGLIVVMQAFFGLDAYQLFGTAWMTANLLFGLALIPLGIWMSKKFAEREARSPFLQHIMKDLAGDSLNGATAFLATLSEFEQEQVQN